MVVVVDPLDRRGEGVVTLGDIVEVRIRRAGFAPPLSHACAKFKLASVIIEFQRYGEVHDAAPFLVGILGRPVAPAEVGIVCRIGQVSACRGFKVKESWGLCLFISERNIVRILERNPSL